MRVCVCVCVFPCARCSVYECVSQRVRACGCCGYGVCDCVCVCMCVLNVSVRVYMCLCVCMRLCADVIVLHAVVGCVCRLLHTRMHLHV